jgi:glycine cleavage system transcriptional repressor
MTGSLLVSVKEIPPEPEPAPLGATYLLSVHGADRPGIVSSVTSVVADADGNITDLSTRLSGELYVLLAEVELPPTADVAALTSRLQEQGTGAWCRGDVARARHRRAVTAS